MVAKDIKAQLATTTPDTITQVATSDQLRGVIHDASLGKKVLLEHGCELAGPFILERPVQVIGEGQSTCLYSKGVPVAVIRSGGVRLEKLAIERADGSDEVAILVIEGSQPDLVEVEVSKGRVEIVAKEQLIDLGDLVAGAAIDIPVEIETDGPTTFQSASGSLQVDPVNLPGPGKHLVRLRISGNNLVPKEVLILELKLVSGANKKSLWATGRVIDRGSPGLLEGKIQLVAPNGQRIIPVTGLRLGKKTLTGVPGADQLSEAQAGIICDSSGCWAIVQAGNAAMPTKVGGAVLERGQRRLLRQGDVVAIGSLALKADKDSAGSSVELDKRVLDFGDVSNIGIATTSVNIRGVGKGLWQGTLVSTVPWIEVITPTVKCNQGQVVRLDVRPSPDIYSLPLGSHYVAGALLLLGKNEVICLDANALVKEFDVILEASTTLIDFGEVEDSQGVPEQTLILRNKGKKDWAGAMRLGPSGSWLSAPVGVGRCPAGGQINIPLRPSAGLDKLPPGEHKSAAALIFEGGGGALQVGARVKIKDPVSVLEMQPGSLDFGDVEQGASPAAKTIIVRNRGKKDWAGTVRSTVPWLTVTNTAGVCPAGSQILLTATINFELPPGEHKTATALFFESAIAPAPVGIRVVIKEPVPRLDVEPAILDFGRIESSLGNAAQTVVVRNRGRKNWFGSVSSTVPWLTPSRNKGFCAAGGEQSFQVRINDSLFALPAGVTMSPGALILEGAGIRIEVGARVAIGQPTLRLTVDTTLLDFTEVDDPMVVADKTISIRNEGTKDCDCTISSVHWITVSHTSLRLRAGDASNISVRVNEELDKLAPGEIDQPDALIIRGNGVSLKIAAQLTIKQDPAPEIDPRELDFGIVEDWRVVAPMGIVVRHSKGHRVWHSQVRVDAPWLETDLKMISCPPGQVSELKAFVTRGLEKLRPGRHKLDGAIVLASNDTTVPISATVAVREPQPVLTFEPLIVDFGEVEDWRMGHRIEVVARNLRTRDWNGHIHALQPWFKASVDDLVCPQGQTAKFSVELTEQVDALGPSEHSGQLVLEGLAQTASLSVRVVKKELEIILEADQLVCGHIADWQGAPPLAVRLRNKGRKDGVAAITSALPWLAPSETNVSCPAMSTIEVPVHLTEDLSDLADGSYIYPEGLIITTNGKRLPVSVQIDISRLGITVTPEFIHFGEVRVNEWDDQPAREVILRSKKGSWTGTIEAPDWIVVQPPAIKCPSSGEVHFKVHLKTGAGVLRHQGRNEESLLIQAAGEQLKINIVVNVAKASREKEKRDVDIEENAELVVPSEISFDVMSDWRSVPPQSTELRNSGGSWCRGTATSQVSWLTVSPSNFECPPGGVVALEVKLKPIVFRPRGDHAEYKAIQIQTEKKEWWVDVHLAEGQQQSHESSPGETLEWQPGVQPGKLGGLFQGSQDEQNVSVHPGKGFDNVASPKQSGGMHDSTDSAPSQKSIGSGVGPLISVPSVVDFGEVSNWNYASVVSFEIRNDGSEAWSAVVETEVNWLEVQPSTFVCVPSAVTRVSVSLKRVNVFERPQRGEHTIPRAMIVRGGGKEYEITVHLSA